MYLPSFKGESNICLIQITLTRLPNTHMQALNPPNL